MDEDSVTAFGIIRVTSCTTKGSINVLSTMEDHDPTGRDGCSACTLVLICWSGVKSEGVV